MCPEFIFKMESSSVVKYIKLIVQCNVCSWVIKECNLNNEIFNDYLISSLSYPKNNFEKLRSFQNLLNLSNDHFWN